MNKTVSVNISGMAFTINDDAYKKLNDYIQSIERSFNNDKETISGIESRIAELLCQYLSKLGRQVVEMSDVDMVIEQIGNPIQMNQETASTEASKDKAPRKLFRDKLNGIVGGVSSGLAVYTGMDAAIIRLIWLLLFLLGNGLTTLVYVVFWIILPEAKTPAQRVEMKGLPQTAENIQNETTAILNTNSGSGCLGMLCSFLVVISAIILIFPLLFLLFLLLFIIGTLLVGLTVPAFAGMSTTISGLAIAAIFLCPLAALVYLCVTVHKRGKGIETSKKQKLIVYLTLLVMFLSGLIYMICNSHLIAQNLSDMRDSFGMMIQDSVDYDKLEKMVGAEGLTIEEIDINDMPTAVE